MPRLLVRLGYADWRWCSVQSSTWVGSRSLRWLSRCRHRRRPLKGRRVEWIDGQVEDGPYSIPQ